MGGGGRCAAHIISRISLDHSRDSHRGGFSRLEPGFPPEAAWCPCGFPPRQKKKKKNAPRLADAKPSLLEEENEALWKEFGGMAVNASQDYFRGVTSFVWILHHKGH